MSTGRLICNAQDQIMSRYGSQLAAIGKKAPIAMRDALNREGRQGQKEIRRALIRQTRLKASSIRRALDPNTREATAGRLAFEMRTRGGEIRLRHYGPSETPAGVRHRSPKVQSPVRHSFMKGGSFARGRFARRPPVSSGEVWTRIGRGRYPLRAVKSGVWIPKEMVTGESRDSFRAISFRLRASLGEHLSRYLPG